MACSLSRVDELLNTHYREASEGLVEKAPSSLSRGEGTEKDFYIFKIDLANSTALMNPRRKGTYLKLAHTFLSTVDRITQDYGADANQVEYAGDSVLAYFPANSTSAEDALSAAFYSAAAVERAASLGGVLGDIPLKFRLVLHFATLVVAKIGPRADSIISAIGQPIHYVAKLEKEIGVGVGRATLQFREKLLPVNRKFLNPVYTEYQELLPVIPELYPSNQNVAHSSPQLNALAGLLGALTQARGLINSQAQSQPLSLSNALMNYPRASNTPAQYTAPAPVYRTSRKVTAYDLAWPNLRTALK